MDANTTIDLAVLHQVISATLAAQFPALETVEFYREESEREPLTDAQLPACLLEMEELEPADPADDPMTEQLPVYARFAARLIIGFRTQNAKLEIRKLAASVATYLRKHPRWPHPTLAGKTLPTGPAEVLAIMPDDFAPELDRYEVWRVEWRHLIHLGATVWTSEGVTPGTPLYGWSPEIGTPHDDDYSEALP